MHPSTLLLALAAALTTATEIIPGYTIVPIDWEIEVSPGKIATLNGTVQEVIAQAQAINPGFALQGVSPKPASAAAKLRRRGQQSRRGPLSRRGVDFCNHFGNADVDAILEGVDYLHRLGGSANMKAGPRVCSRISCSYNSAIYACNDVSVLSLDFGGGGGGVVVVEEYQANMVEITELWPQVGNVQWARQQRGAHHRDLPLARGRCVAVHVGAEFRAVVVEYDCQGG